MDLKNWLKERELNARRIASGKTGHDRDGWLEDAAYFKAAHDALGPVRTPMTHEQRRALIDAAGDKTDGLNQDDFADEIIRSVERFHHVMDNGLSSTRQPSEVEKFMDAAGLCRRCAAPIQPTDDEAAVIQNLLDLARHVDHALDDSEEVEFDGYRSHNIAGQDFDDVVEALAALEDLPDDKPGMTLGPSGKAEWALRRLLPNTQRASHE